MTFVDRNFVFAIGSIFVRAGLIITATAAVILAICVPLSIILQDNVFSAAQSHFSEPVSTYPVAAVAGLVTVSAVIVALAYLLLRNLHQIIKTAKAGDPFAPKNAHRFTRMAWLMLAIQLLKYPTAWLALIVETAFKGPTSDVEIGGTFTGILIVLVLFMLALIFRHGADMREKLQGDA